ncbi:MAG: hypothetical protein FWF06_05755, partial [Symbiobacteriaceae bacterium]|nr:hypothetical protein [Symbiobacteriaceae bacterium]
MRKIFSKVFICLLAGIILCSSVAQVAAAILETYQIKLFYYDSIMVHYTVHYPAGGFWTGSEDVPVGGAYRLSDGKALASQVYCIDPFTPFIPRADENDWSDEFNATIVSKDGYAVASPWNLSTTMLYRYSDVSWLLSYGYRGDYRAHDAESMESVARLNRMYQGTPGMGTISKRVALMATKVAIWKAIGGDNVEVRGTVLTGAEASTFNILWPMLLSDARVGTPPVEEELNLTQLELTFDFPGGTVLPFVHNDGEGDIYGPFIVEVALKDARSTAEELLENVILMCSGIDSGDILFGFYDDFTHTWSPLTTTAPLYGTPADTLYTALEGSEFEYTPGAEGSALWTSPELYIWAPDGRDSLLNSTADQLTIRAMAQTAPVELQEGTPICYVFYVPEDDSLKWSAIQAFAGAAALNTSAPLGAENQFYSQETPLGQLWIAKYLLNATPLDEGVEFGFKLYMHSSSNPSDYSPVILSHYDVRGARVDYANDIFYLKNPGLAFIDGLPLDRLYSVEEINNNAIYWLQSYSIDIYDNWLDDGEIEVPLNKGDDTITEPFALDPDLTLGMVTFNNISDHEVAYLYLSKFTQEILENGSIDYHYTDGELIFAFCIEYTNDLEFPDWQSLDLSGKFASEHSLNPSAFDDAEHGFFTLQAQQTAVFMLDAEFAYRLGESVFLADGSTPHEYTPGYNITARSKATPSYSNQTDTSYNLPNAQGYYMSQGFYLDKLEDTSFALVFSNVKENTPEPPPPTEPSNPTEPYIPPNPRPPTPFEPPTRPPTDPPTRPPTDPPTDPPTLPPTDPPTRPPTDPYVPP